MDERQRQETQIRKRVACEERAFNVVLRLLDDQVTEDYLADACQLIAPDHYADVVEERSIAKLCGYPLCGNSLDKIPKQRYKISTKTNMVYDITERKKFCSNYCFKSSQYFEKQISSSPVWARENEARVNFEFLQVPQKSCSAGDAVFLPLPQTEIKKVVQTLEKLDHTKSQDEKPDDNRESRESHETLVNAEESSSNLLSDVVDRIANVQISYNKEVDGINVDFTQNSCKEESVHSGEIIHRECSQNSKQVMTTFDGSDQFCSVQDPELLQNKDTKKENTGESGNDEELKLSETSAASTETSSPAITGPRQGESAEDYVMRLLDRKKHLLGQLADIQQRETSAKRGSESVVVDSDEEEEEEESEITKDKDNCEQCSHTKDDLHVKPSIQELRPQGDRQRSVESIQSTLPEKPKEPASNPCPKKLLPLKAVARVMEEWFTRDSYKFLDVCKYEDAQSSTSDPEFERKYLKMCHRVAEDEKDFEKLLGEEMMEESIQASHDPIPDYEKLEMEARQNELRVIEFYKGSAGGTRKQKEMEQDREGTVQLPVVDSHDQMTIRRKIVLDRLNKVIPDLLTPLRLSIQDVSQLIRELVFTFSFSSKNILFKPGEWSLVGILLLKLLSMKSKRIELSFEEQSASKYFSIIFSSLGHKIEDLNDVVREMTSLISHR